MLAAVVVVVVVVEPRSTSFLMPTSRPNQPAKSDIRAFDQLVEHVVGGIATAALTGLARLLGNER